MSEYAFVEKPFLEQLAALGWRVVDQGAGLPMDPTQSHRTSFREVILRDLFHRSVRAINATEDGQPWLTDAQIEELFEQIVHQPGKSLVEANEEVLRLLYRTQVDVNEVTGEEYPNVRLIDFHHPECNHFLAINQFRIDTPGAGRAFIIPDIVLFVNGLPLVVIECKDANGYRANPMYEAFRQLLRCCDQRTETRLSGLREGEPGRFDTNQLLIRTCGEQAEFGTITSTDEEFFFGWNDIYPETYRNYTPPLGTERAQERLIQGMLPPATLLDIVRNGTLFMELDKTRVKIVCRYQQYRAVCKIIDRLRTSMTPAERSGVIWHTQGSGKSLTIVFVIRVIRKLRMCDEKVTTIASTGELKTQLATATSNLNMVMVHKFWEQHNRGISDYLESVLERVPTFERFGLVNSSERILLMIDEAHRTQSGDLGDNLFEAFPNATRLAFTGTPLIDGTASRVSVPRQPRSTTSLASSPSAATVCPIPMSRRSSGSRQRSWRCCSAPLPSSTSGATVPKSVNSKGFYLISSCSPRSTRSSGAATNW